jgi:hypothetical protein
LPLSLYFQLNGLPKYSKGQSACGHRPYTLQKAQMF